MKFLNIGCGRDVRRDKNPEVEWVNLDRTEPADVIADLEEPLPFKSNTFRLIYAHSILEHIRNYDQLRLEIHRVLEPSGQLHVHVPDFTSPDAYGDPDHVRIFSFHSFYTMYWHGMVTKNIETYCLPDPLNIKSQFTKLRVDPHTWLHAILVKLTDEEIERSRSMNLWDQKRGYYQPK